MRNKTKSYLIGLRHGSAWININKLNHVTESEKEKQRWYWYWGLVFGFGNQLAPNDISCGGLDNVLSSPKATDASANQSLSV